MGKVNREGKRGGDAQDELKVTKDYRDLKEGKQGQAGGGQMVERGRDGETEDQRDALKRGEQKQNCEAQDYGGVEGKAIESDQGICAKKKNMKIS